MEQTLTKEQIQENVNAIREQGGTDKDVSAYVSSVTSLTETQQGLVSAQEALEKPTSGIRSFLGITPQSELLAKKLQRRNQMEAEGYSPTRIGLEEIVGDVKDAALHTAQVAPLVISAPAKASWLVGGAVLGLATGSMKTVEELIKGEDVETAAKRGVTTGAITAAVPAAIEGVIVGGKAVKAGLRKLGRAVAESKEAVEEIATLTGKKKGMQYEKKDLDYAVRTAKRDMEDKIESTKEYMSKGAREKVERDTAKYTGEISNLEDELFRLDESMSEAAKKVSEAIVNPVNEAKKVLSRTYDNILEKNGALTEEGMKAVDINDTLVKLSEELNIPAKYTSVKQNIGAFIRDIVAPRLDAGGAEKAKLIKIGDSLASSDSQRIVLRDAHWMSQLFGDYGRNLIKAPASFDLGSTLLRASDAIKERIDDVASGAYKAVGAKWGFMRRIEEQTDSTLGKVVDLGNQSRRGAYRKKLNVDDFTDVNGKVDPEKIQKLFSEQVDKVQAIRDQIDLLRSVGEEKLTKYADTLEASLTGLVDKTFSRKKLVSAIDETLRLKNSVDKEVRETLTDISDQAIRSLKSKVSKVEQNVVKTQRSIEEEGRAIEQQIESLKPKVRKHDDISLLALGIVASSVARLLAPFGGEGIAHSLDMLVALYAVNKYHPEFGYFTEKAISAAQKVINKRIVNLPAVTQGIVNEFMRNITTEMYAPEETQESEGMPEEGQTEGGL